MRDSRQAASPPIRSDTSWWPERRSRLAAIEERVPAAQYTTTGVPVCTSGGRDVQGAVDGACGALAGVAHVQEDRRLVPADRLSQVAGCQAAGLVHLAGDGEERGLGLAQVAGYRVEPDPVGLGNTIRGVLWAVRRRRSTRGGVR